MEAEEPELVIDAEEPTIQNQEEPDQAPESRAIAAAAVCLSLSPYSKLRVFPHACMALSDHATWGSQDSMTDTDLPSDTLHSLEDLDPQEDLEEVMYFDEDYVV